MSISNQTQSTETSTPNPSFFDHSAFSAAYERKLPEILAVSDAELALINVDVNTVVTSVLGVLPEILALRESIAKLPEIEHKLVDGLEDYAQAAGEANSRYATAMAPREDIVALNDEAMKLREMFRSDAVALAKRGLIDPARLASFTGQVGYKNVAFDLIDYANLLSDCWSKIQGKTAIEVSEIQHAKDVGERLVRAAGQREQGPAVVVETARIRQQAFTLLVKAYDETRRAVSFLRWREGDADTIAPSLYAGRGGRGKPAAPVADTGPVAGAAGLPGAPGVSVANGTARAPVTSGGSRDPGLPGALPFSAS